MSGNLPLNVGPIHSELSKESEVPHNFAETLSAS